MAQADLTFITFIAPVAVFLIVAIVVFAVLAKTGIVGKSKWINVFIALFVASVFISSAGVRQLATTIVPWFAVLLLSLFFLLVFIGFIGKGAEFMTKGVGVAVVILFVIIFLVSAFVIFSNVIVNYLPGPGYGGPSADPGVLTLTDWIYSPRVFGAILLLVISALVSWVLVKFG